MLRLCLILLMAVLCRPAAAEVSGVDSIAPMGKWLNGTFPPSAPGASGSWTVVDAFPGLRFIDPVKLVAQPRSDRLHVLGKDGYIWSFANSPATTSKTLVLDIRTRVQSTDNAGLVGMAFHPDFGLPGSPDRGYVYLFYYYSPAPLYAPFPQGDRTDMPAYVRLSRFTMPDGAQTLDPASEFVLLQQWDRQAWHNGGSLCFDNDGYLLFAMGDEGLDSDYFDSMQKFDRSLWGGVFRIDVDNNPARSHPLRRQPYAVPAQHPALPAGWPRSSSQGYSIPDDNPWVDPSGSRLEEYYAIGVRSPHTMTYDALTGGIWLGDVGQALWEEMNLIVRGGDYQWPYREGDHAFFDADFGKGAIQKTHTLPSTPQPPVWEYTHNSAGGTAVIGGYVYRGREHANSLTGKVLVSDHGNPVISHVWALTPGTGGAPAAVELLCDMPAGGFHRNMAAWGQDQHGEPYLIRLEGAAVENAFVPPVNASGALVTKPENGRIYKLARTGSTVPEPPALLSQTGAFSSLGTLTPAPGILPYAPNAPFWSDGAAKQRWIALPQDGSPDTNTERIQRPADHGNWTFPEGTVLIKHFAMPLDERNPAVTQRLETRFFVLGTGGQWYGVSYRWRADGSDADLLYGAAAADLTLTDSAGAVRTQRWDFPGRSDCMVCHNPSAGSALGLRTHQLNGDLTFPATGRTANQLYTLGALGLLTPAPTAAELAALPRACRPDDLSQPLELRARSWLDTNCSACHRPGGAGADFDARFTTPLASQNLLNGPLRKTAGLPGEAVVRAHHPDVSAALTRASALGPGAMPPLAKNRVDTAGTAAFRAWILSLDPDTWPASGLLGEYFSTPDLTSPAFTRTDATIAFDWANGSPDPRLAANGFSVRWSGRVTAPVTGSYTLSTYSDDGTRIRLGGNLILDKWIDHTAFEYFATPVTLTAGVSMPLEVDFYERVNAAGIFLRWSGPGLAKQTVPVTALRLPLPANAPPSAHPDSASLLRGDTLTIPVLANDTDYEGNLAPATLRIVRPPAAGTATPAAGAVSYQSGPGSGFLTDSFTYAVSDSAGLESDEVQVSLTLTPAAEAWRTAQFSAAQLADPALSGWEADPDGDGLTNLMEYATGHPPLTASPAAAPTLTFPADGLTEVTFPLAEGTAVLVSAEISPDAITWNAAGPDIVLTTSPAGPVTVRFPVNGGTRRFLRLRLTLR